MKSFSFTSMAAIAAGSIYAQQPNIIYIMTDHQTARAMSCVDDTYVKTPNLDKLAEDGVRFSNAYCAAPLSGPSRFVMFTGITAGSARMMKNNAPFPDIPKEETLGNLVSSAGYLPAYAGKWHIPKTSLPTDDRSFGFISIHPHNDYGLAKSCIRFLEQNHEKPFFLVASFDNPHNICEYARNQTLPFATIEEPDIEDCPNLPSNFYPAPYEAEIIRLEQQMNFPLYPVINYFPDDWRRYLNAYYRLIEIVDSEIGKIIDALVRLGLYDDAVIIFTSDHGDGVAANQWNQKSALFEEVVNVPFIVKDPNAFGSNIERNELINSGIDLLPTICDYASAEVPSHISGKSVRNLVESKDAGEIHPFIVTETQFDNSSTRGWMVRTPRYKYVLYDKGKYREQLFDIDEDRQERRNLAIENKYREVVNHHRALLDGWFEQNNISNTGRMIPPLEGN